MDERFNQERDVTAEMIDKRNLVLSAASAGILLLSPVTSFGQVSKDPAHSWGYSTTTGPTHWAELSPEFATCKLGHHQSPIDIRDTKKADLPPILFNYKPSFLRIVDNGHTVEVDYPPGSSISVGGKTYQLVQFHFHHPSEALIHGKRSQLEVHLVHSDAEGNKAVVAVLINPGRSNDFLQSIFSHVPHEKENEEESRDVMVDATKLLPEARSYYTFPGSLTTPPCSENVTWFVLKNAIEGSDSQIKMFSTIYKNDARPAQPLNGRTILESQ